MKPDGKAEPRFDIDVIYGRQGELQIADYLTWISAGNGRIEVKRKRYLDLDFYVETAHSPGRTGVYCPSGISVTTADAWAFVIGDTGIALIIPTDELRAMLEDPSSHDKEESAGSCPTRGRLISLNVLLYRRKQQQQKAVDVKREPMQASTPLTAADIPWGGGTRR